MLNVLRHPQFDKEFKKLPKKLRAAFNERFLRFLKNPHDVLLKDHPLKGWLQGKRAFSVTGDVRVVYRYVGKNTLFLLRIGTHNQVY